MKKLFICHSGAELPALEQDIMGIIGMVYVWQGEWLRSPESTEHSDRNPVMKLKPLLGPDIEIWGDTGCFTEAEHAMHLQD